MIPRFRAWDEKDREMCDVISLDWKHEIIELSNGYAIWPRDFFEVELMQATGVTSIYDDNNTEFYEGDIVKTKSSPRGRFIGYVGNAVSRFEVRGVKQYKGFKYDLDGSYVVIGNIHQNPELLEGE